MPDKSIAIRTNAEATFLAVLPFVERAIAALAARYGLDADEKDDFTSAVMEKLLQDDYAVIRSHRGDATLETYLATVIANLYRDTCVQRWGRWRPSAAAQRAGPHGVRMEVLVNRDGMSVDQAIEVLRSEGVTIPPSELRRMWLLFPPRTNSRKHSRSMPAEAEAKERADDLVEAGDRNATRDRATAVLQAALTKLSPADQLLLKLRIWDGMRVADMARALNLPQKPLYRRIELCQKQLRKALESDGIDEATVRELLSDE